MDFTTPPSYGSTVVNVGGIAVDGKILCAGSDNRAEHVKVKSDSQNDWDEPEEVKFVWNGKSKDGENVSAVLEGPFGRRTDKVDIMEKVPGFIKTIVGGVAGTKPYIYQVGPKRLQRRDVVMLTRMQYIPKPKLSLRVTVGGKETIEEGELFSEATFIS